MPLLPFYIASAVAAAGLLYVLRPGKRSIRRGGAVVALAGVGLFMSEGLRLAGPPSGGVPIPLLVAMAAIGLYAAVRVITHPRPVFAALYFIVTVVASAVIFLLLQAEFMAFALIIVYAGAILITYMFVLMLADQGPRELVGHLDEDDYDRIPREPMAAVLVGFVLLATLSAVVERVPATAVLAESSLDQKVARQQAAALVMMPRQLLKVVQQTDAAAVSVSVAPNAAIQGSVVQAQVVHADGSTRTIPVDAAGKIENTQMVGLDLVARYPASLELAGIILLMAMFGAVVLARRQIEFGEDEVRDAAGLRRIVLDVPEHERAAPGGGA